MALKYGVFPDLPLAYFLFIIAISGIVSYIICAIIFTAKTKQAKEEKSLSKGVLLKRSVQLYSLVYAIYLGLVFMLMMSF